MKRYTVVSDPRNRIMNVYSAEHEAGEWCKWDEVESLVVQAGAALIREQDLNKRISELEISLKEIANDPWLTPSARVMANKALGVKNE